MVMFDGVDGPMNWIIYRLNVQSKVEAVKNSWMCVDGVVPLNENRP